jgi:hypothetical protein
MTLDINENINASIQACFQAFLPENKLQCWGLTFYSARRVRR